MKLWFTPAELAELELPGLPASKRNINALADREGWNGHARFARDRAGRGGGTEYHIDLLPAEARLAYLGRHMAASGVDLADEGSAAVSAASDPAPATAPAASSERDARLAVLGAFDAFRRTADLPKFTAIGLFADLYNANTQQMPDWVRGRIARLSGRTLARWIAARGNGEIEKLAVDRGASRRGLGVLDAAEGGRLKAAALGLIAHQPHLTADHVRTILLDKFGDTVDLRGARAPMPDIRAFQDSLKRWKIAHSAELLAITNPDAHKSRARVSGSRAHLVTRLNERWEIDASPVDALCIDGRHSVYVCIDVFSRRMITYVSRTPRAEAVGLLLRKALMQWGVPELIKTDNGSDFTARATVRFLAALQIEVSRSDPYSPEQKGVVERSIGTMQRDIGPLLPGFIGHDVKDRKAIEQRRSFAARLGIDDGKAFSVELTGEQLQRDMDAWANDRYAHRPHGGIDRQTPFARAASYSGTIRRIESEAALAVLLAPVAGQDGRRTVGKQGVRIDGSHYIVPGILPGETVFVRMDPADMGQCMVFDAAGETFLTIGICPELAGVDPAAAVQAARAAQKRLIDERSAEIRAEARKIKPRDMVDAVARQAAAKAGKLVELPRHAQAYTTPAIDAAARARRGKRIPEAAPMRPGDTALMAGIEAELAAEARQETPVAQSNVRQLRTSETREQRFRRCLALEAAMEAGTDISTDDALWLGRYRETPECKGLRAVYADFGETALR